MTKKPDESDLESDASRVKKVGKPFTKKKLVEGTDYYLYPNGGLLVFTREYHLNRGSCCKSRCRHCPYGFNPDAIPTPEWVRPAGEDKPKESG